MSTHKWSQHFTHVDSAKWRLNARLSKPPLAASRSTFHKDPQTPSSNTNDLRILFDYDGPQSLLIVNPLKFPHVQSSALALPQSRLENIAPPSLYSQARPTFQRLIIVALVEALLALVCPSNPFSVTKDKIESQIRPQEGAEEGVAAVGGSGRQDDVLGQKTMPGVIMENGGSNGAHTNHDRDTILNGVNGTTHAADRAVDKGKGRQDLPQSPFQTADTNGGGSNGIVLPAPAEPQTLPVQSTSKDLAKNLVNQIEQLPPEILHITEGFESLSTLLSRLAQVTHNRLSNKIMDLAAMPTPASAINGNGAHYNVSDDNSGDNVRKKHELIKFVTDTHADWTKALVITKWSRISEEVSRVIDLKVHLDKQKWLYDAAVYELSEVKRSLSQARVPNPDLKTAVAVLSTGKASWLSDLGYLEPPPLTAKELLKALQNLNTLLSMRLNLHEYDRIPVQFKDYSIKSGRVSFRVPGEFEVDLTIADENPGTQFWFIDFRFLFSPALSQLPESLLYMIESKVNAALEKDGLAGCYTFLHELVLTHKISELRRQAVELNRGRWIEKLRVEPLRRALSIQYWVERYNKDFKDGPKSWIIIGVHSGKRKDGTYDPRSTSRISIRWFREGKEVKDLDMPMDLTDLSVESLLQSVISRHVDYILGSTYQSLSTKPLFARHELSLSYKASNSNSSEAELKVQLTRQDNVSITIEPVTGEFAISPATRLTQGAQANLNNKSKDPAANAHEFIQNLRCVAITDEIVSRALTVGWQPIQYPKGLKQEDLRPIVPRDTLQMSWFRRTGWSQEWILALSCSMSGERWWLLETNNSDPRNLQIRSHLQIPLKTTSPNPTHSFLLSLRLVAAAMISNHVNIRALHMRRSNYMLRNESSTSSTSLCMIPSIFVKTEDLLRSRNQSPRSGKAWAGEYIKISFQGLEYHSLPRDNQVPPSPTSQQPAFSSVDPETHGGVQDTKNAGEVESAIIVAESQFLKAMPPGLDLVNQRVDKDIAFHPKSRNFAFRLHTKVGESSIKALTERLQRIEQLVDFVEVLKEHERTLTYNKISLGQLIFSYGSKSASASLKSPEAMTVDEDFVTYRATIDFADGKAPMSIKLEINNPHIRIIDHLTKILNSTLGLSSMANVLPLTLNVMKALCTIEDSWPPDGVGEVNIISRAIDWHMVRYTLPPETPEQEERRCTLEIKLQHRCGKAWWCVRREPNLSNGLQGNPTSDEIDSVLKTIWDNNADGQQWRGMATSAISRPEDVEEMLGKIDSTLRKYSTNGKDTIFNSEVEQLMSPTQSQNVGLGIQIPNAQHQQAQQQHQISRNGKKPVVIDLD